MGWLWRLAKWIVVVGVLLTLGLPPLIGLVLKPLYPTILNQVDAQLPDYQLSSVRTNWGWFASSAKSTWQGSNGAVIEYDSRLQHGPLILADPGLRLGWWADQAAPEDPMPPAWVDYRVGLGGLVVGDWNSLPRPPPPGQWSDAAELSVAGGGAFELDLIGQQLRVGSHGARIELVTPQGPLTVRVTGDLRQAATQLELALSASELSLAGERRADTLSLTSAAAVTGGQAELRLDANGEQLRWLDEQFDLRALSLRIQQLDQPTLIQLWARASELQQSGTPGWANQWQAELLLALPALTQHRPRLHIEQLALTTADGSLSGELLLELPNGAPPAALVDPQRLLASLRLSAQLKLPAQLLTRQAQRYVQRQRPWLRPAEALTVARGVTDGWQRDGWLVARGNQLELVIELDHGRLTVNGIALPLPG